METNLKNKYQMVTFDKETIDTGQLIQRIRNSGWVTPEMTIVNCFPEYSSRVSQVINHRLSHLNKNDLFEVIDLAMPYPNMAQVWNVCDRKYQGFYNYLTDWVRTNVFSTNRYLFVSAAENLSVIRTFLKVKLEPDDYRFATLYIKEEDPEPDFWIEKTKKEVLFEWENVDNPNWKY